MNVEEQIDILLVSIKTLLDRVKQQQLQIDFNQAQIKELNDKMVKIEKALMQTTCLETRQRWFNLFTKRR